MLGFGCELMGCLCQAYSDLLQTITWTVPRWQTDALLQETVKALTWETWININNINKINISITQAKAEYELFCPWVCWGRALMSHSVRKLRLTFLPQHRLIWEDHFILTPCGTTMENIITGFGQLMSDIDIMPCWSHMHGTSLWSLVYQPYVLQFNNMGLMQLLLDTWIMC